MSAYFKFTSLTSQLRWPREADEKWGSQADPLNAGI